MLSNVPQFVDIEDRIVGPLTAKQLGWLALGGVILLVLWSLLSIGAFIVSAVFVAILFVGLAFYRPYNQPLLSFILSSVGFLFRPKMYIWKRLPDKEIRKAAVKEEAPAIIQKKSIDEEKIQEISKLLDITK
jgi:hypothetical protein